MIVLASASWLPRPFEEYETGELPNAASPHGTRRFAHSWSKVLEDGSRLALEWKVDTNPETLLELDLAHRKGTHILECAPDRLVLKIPSEDAAKASKWLHVTASHAVHGCQHLTGKDLYHKVLGMRSKPAIGMLTHAIVILQTKELLSPAEMFPFMQVHVKVSPIEAFHPSAARTLSSRRLFDASLAPLPGSFHIESHFADGEVRGGPGDIAPNRSEQVGSFSVESELLVNDTTSSQYTLTVPGGEAYVKFFKPSMDVTMAQTLNITSHIDQLLDVPSVKIDAELEGYSRMTFDMALAGDFDGNESDYAPEVIDNLIDRMPLLRESLASYLHPYVMYLGGTPLSILPGVKIGMKLDHRGAMKGSLRFGFDTIIRMNGSFHFDTDSFKTTSNVIAITDFIKVTPPSWMVIAKDFDMDMHLTPTMFLEGSFGPLRDVGAGFALNAHVNMSILGVPISSLFDANLSIPFGDEPPRLLTPSSPIGSEEALAEMKAQCTPSALSVRLGVDVQVAPKEYNAQLLKMMAGMAGVPFPDISTKPTALWNLGDELDSCPDGICEATIPECMELADVSNKRILLKLSRCIDLNDVTGGQDARDIVAYGLSVLPHAIDISLHEIDHVTAGTSGNLDAGTIGLNIAADLNEKKLEDAHLVTRVIDHAKGFWHNLLDTCDRRLQALRTGLDTQETTSSRSCDKPTYSVSVKDHVAYAMTEDGLRKLLAQDAFRGFVDGQESKLGPITVVGASLIEVPGSNAKQQQEQSRQFGFLGASSLDAGIAGYIKQSGHQQALSAFVAPLLVVAALAALALRHRSAGYERLSGFPTSNLL